MRTDTNAKKGNHQEAKVIQDPGPVKGVVVVEAVIEKSHGPEAERENAV